MAIPLIAAAAVPWLATLAGGAGVVGAGINAAQNTGGNNQPQSPNRTPAVPEGAFTDGISSLVGNTVGSLNPTFGVNGASTSGGTATRAVSGGGVGGGAYDPAAAQYYEDQINQVNAALSRIGAQRDIGRGNILSSYNEALNSLTGQNSQALRDAGITRQRAIDDNVRARADIDANVARQSQSLRRLLGNSSSAANFAAPLAVAQAGNQQQGVVQTAYGRNLQGLDIADEDRRRAYQEAQRDLTRQRTQSESALEAGLLQNEAQLNETLGGLNLQRAQSQGQNYSQARSASLGYTDRVNNILSQIDQLGRNPSIRARQVNYTAPNLEQYSTAPISAALGQQSPANAAAGQYSYLLGDERRRRMM
jgi:hypothetical protein